MPRKSCKVFAYRSQEKVARDVGSAGITISSELLLGRRRRNMAVLHTRFDLESHDPWQEVRQKRGIRDHDPFVACRLTKQALPCLLSFAATGSDG